MIVVGRDKALEPGDKINCKGITCTIAEIVSQEYVEGDGFFAEFRDTDGAYRNWKQWIDGGEVIPKKLNGMALKKEIERIFKKARDMRPDITDDMLLENGAIYYDEVFPDMETNEFFWSFSIYYANHEAFIVAEISEDNAVDARIYKDGEFRSSIRFNDALMGLSPLDKEFFMYHIADLKMNYDTPIDRLNWDMELDKPITKSPYKGITYE